MSKATPASPPQPSDLLATNAARVLVSLKSGGAADSAGVRILPTELVIAPWGEFEALDGTKLRVGEKTATLLGVNQTSQGFEEVVLDFSHNSCSSITDDQGKPVPPAEPLKVAAYGKLSVEPGRGIIFTPTSWTSEGKDHYRGGHYKDLSPSILHDEEGEVIFVHSVALTRNGQVAGLHAYSAPGNTPISPTDNTMETNEKYRALLLRQLKLPDDATDEQIAAAMEAKPAKVVSMDADMTKDMSATILKELKSLSARVDASEKQSLINRASLEGKVIPLSADAIKAMPTSVLAELVEKSAAGIVPLSSKTPGTIKEAARKVELSAEAKKVCAQLGVSEDDYKKNLRTA